MVIKRSFTGYIRTYLPHGDILRNPIAKSDGIKIRNKKLSGQKLTCREESILPGEISGTEIVAGTIPS